MGECIKCVFMYRNECVCLCLQKSPNIIWLRFSWVLQPSVGENSAYIIFSHEFMPTSTSSDDKFSNVQDWCQTCQSLYTYMYYCDRLMKYMWDLTHVHKKLHRQVSLNLGDVVLFHVVLLRNLSFTQLMQGTGCHNLREATSLADNIHGEQCTHTLHTYTKIILFETLTLHTYNNYYYVHTFLLSSKVRLSTCSRLGKIFRRWEQSWGSSATGLPLTLTFLNSIQPRRLWSRRGRSE